MTDKLLMDQTLSVPEIARRRILKGAAAVLATSMVGSGVARAGQASKANVFDVVIIGAGLAGLTAARDLLNAGNHSFVVLEARNRVGGRTLNHQLKNGYISEAGGQWIGPGQTAVADLARELGIGTFKSKYDGKGVFMMGKGKIEIDSHGMVDFGKDVVAKCEMLAKSVPSSAPWTAPNAKELDKMSVADWLTKQQVNTQDMLTWRLASALTIGAGSTKASILHYLSMVNSAGSVQGLEGQKEGAQETRFVGGSQILSTKMAEELQSYLRLKHPVTKIENWNQDITKVSTPSGDFFARKVIIALSPALCNSLVFEPPLPADRAELQRRWPAYAPMAKCAVVYDSAFWFDKGYNGQTGNVDGPLIWSYDNSPPDFKIGVINGFLRIGELSADIEQNKKAIVNILADAMRDKRFLKPLEFHLHDWGQEPYSMTCVSPMPPGLLTSGLMPALTRNEGTLIWSGTETAAIWSGYMDGAVRSGHRAALQALQALRIDQSRAQV